MLPIATIASPTRLLTIRINKLNARCMEAPFHLSFVLREYSALENDDYSRECLAFEVDTSIP